MAYVVIIPLYIAIFFMYETSGKSYKRGYFEELIAITKINALLAVTLTVVMFLFQKGAFFSRLFFFLFFMFNILITLVFRQYFKILLFAVYRKSKSSNKIMIITTSDQIYNVLARFRSEFDWEYQITYLTILDKSLIGQKIDGIEVSRLFEYV
jgi:FlaA1/EpsC-like NDP-sugar epimerase